MHKLISPCQSAFIPGRWIAENEVVVQEVLHSFKKRKVREDSLQLNLTFKKPMIESAGRFCWMCYGILALRRDLLHGLWNVYPLFHRLYWLMVAGLNFLIQQGDCDRGIPYPRICSSCAKRFYLEWLRRSIGRTQSVGLSWTSAILLWPMWCLLVTLCSLQEPSEMKLKFWMNAWRGIVVGLVRTSTKTNLG